MNQEEAEMERIGPNNISLTNKAFQGRIIIQKGNYSIFGI
jgi:hypothetical protein